MLTGDFFTVRSIVQEKGTVHAVLELNATHKIFGGHFPGQPVVPGACLLQMIKEVMQQVTGNTLRLSVAHNLKFIAPIDPGKNPVIALRITYAADLSISASFLYDEITCCKFNGVFVVYP